MYGIFIIPTFTINLSLSCTKNIPFVPWSIWVTDVIPSDVVFGGEALRPILVVEVTCSWLPRILVLLGCFLKWWIFPISHTPGADHLKKSDFPMVVEQPNILGNPHLVAKMIVTNHSYTPPETNIFAPEVMDGWKTFSFPLGVRPIFRCYVSLREGSKLGCNPIYTPEV